MGLPKGYHHSGQFQKGFDPRRHSPRLQLVPGTNKTLPELCRLKTKEALDVIVDIIRDTKAPIDVRRKAADSLLDRGWGKPEQAVKVEAEVTAKTKDLKDMSTTELMALLMEKQLEDRTMEGELAEEEAGQEIEEKEAPGGVSQNGEEDSG